MLKHIWHDNQDLIRSFRGNTLYFTPRGCGLFQSHCNRVVFEDICKRYGAVDFVWKYDKSNVIIK